MEKEKVLSIFDVESNGLHGEGFALAVITVELKEAGAASFFMACSEQAITDPWVIEQGIQQACLRACNAVPPADAEVAGFTAVVPSNRALRDLFWSWWSKVDPQSNQLWGDTCWPVEANFLSACIADAPEERAFKGPYPLYDAASLPRDWLFKESDFSRAEFCRENYDFFDPTFEVGDEETGGFSVIEKHNPLHDALCSLGVVLRGCFKGEPWVAASIMANAYREIFPGADTGYFDTLSDEGEEEG